MADRKYKLKDVPKGKRLEHFLEYYLLYALGGILVLASLGYLLFGLLKPAPDVIVLWLSGEYTHSCETELRNTLQDLDWDVNGDGQVNEMLTYIEFTDEYSKLSYQTMSEINTLVGGQEYSFFLANGYAVSWMEQQKVLGTWKDAGVDKDGYLKVAVSSLPGFDKDGMEPLQDLYLVITTPDTGKNTEKEYTRQCRALIRYLENGGLL